MGLFDSLKSALQSELNKAGTSAKNNAINNIKKGITNGVNAAVGKGCNRDVKFTFASVPKNLDELKALPEAKLDTAFKTTALVMIVLMNYENDKDKTYEMLDYLMGPDAVSNRAKQLIDECLKDKFYKVKSFFAGATTENNYAPNQPLTITVSENPYSFDEENWATIWVHTSGADSPRPIKLRKKPSTNQWFFTEIQCLSDIKVPVAENPWA